MNSCQHCGGMLGQIDLGRLSLRAEPPSGAVYWYCTRCYRFADPAAVVPELETSLKAHKFIWEEEASLLEPWQGSLLEEMGFSKLQYHPVLKPKPYGQEYMAEFGLTMQNVREQFYRGMMNPVWAELDVDSIKLSPEPKEVPADRPMIEGTVIGYRAWRINFETWRLQGTGAGHGGPDWIPGVNKAECRMYHHPAPDEVCHCGLNALARFSNDEAWWQTADQNLWAQVLGAIEAWSDETDPRGAEQSDAPGRFILHSTGFRAQYARIILLAIDEDWPRAKIGAIRALAAEHGADICKLEHLEDAAKEHGQLIPDELLKWAQGAPETWQRLNIRFGITAKQATEALKHMSQALEKLQVTVGNLPIKGPKQTFKVPGPPTHGKWQQGDVIKDRKGHLYKCVKSGSPGSWMLCI